MKETEKAIKLYEELDSLRPLSKQDELRIMQKFRLDWNYHSNNLEGNSLSFGETKALLLFGITAQGKPLKDHFEVTGHDEAIQYLLEIIHKKRPLTENFIREIHKLILKETYEVDAITPEGNKTKKIVHVGEYKKTPNHVLTKSGKIFRFATPEETPALMKELIDWYRQEINKTKINPILIASEFHYKYIRIHPFDDGNGRTARIIMNFILMQFHYPPVIIKTEDKENYFAVLRQADAGIIEPFVEYIAKNLSSSLTIMINGAKGEEIEEPDDIDKEIALLDKKLQTIGKKIDQVKNLDSIKSFYNESVIKLSNKYIQKSELLNKFYLKNRFNLFVGSKSRKISSEDKYDTARKLLNKDIKNIKLDYQYSTFNNSKFDEFSYKSFININFSETLITITNSNKNKISLVYDDQLSDEQIVEIINDEIRKHKLFIDDQIKLLNKK